MKNILLAALALVFSITAFSQTADNEKKRLTERYQQKDFDESTYVEMGREWNDMLSRTGGYPDLPYDPETDQIEFEWTSSFPNLPKQIIFNRVLEWCAINYGRLSSVLHYEDYESGKIIVKGYFKFYNIKRISRLFKDPVEESTCHHVLAFTIEGNTLKVEAFRINYTFTQYVWSSTYGLQANAYSLPIAMLYPVTDADMLDWMRRLSILHETNENLNYYTSDLFKYIGDYQKDYEF